MIYIKLNKARFIINKGILKAINKCNGQKELAKKCGVTQMVVSYWLNNKTQPSAEKLALIVIASDFTVKPWEIIPSKAIKQVFKGI